MGDERVLQMFDRLDRRVKSLPPWLRMALGALLRGSLLLILWRIHGPL